MLNSIFPLIPILMETTVVKGFGSIITESFGRAGFTLSRRLLASRCYHIVGFGQLVLTPGTKARDRTRTEAYRAPQLVTCHRERVTPIRSSLQLIWKQSSSILAIPILISFR
ncbi:hypothetical protein PR048_000226 [Dryococelus australis]|uniref:Uncharacterized protein n=1 Tax=Dryococelus australis TaxID=614101 RepID=A0ABQ9IE11_9NEOP|nr:hypothetical protein PR048_000226 [Dryococelus australis]